MTWGPLPSYRLNTPTRGGRFIDIQIIGSAIIGGDFYSDNWDGAIPATSLPDSTATAGFYVDSSAGKIQVQSIFAEGGEIGGLTIVNTLTLASGGVIRTTSSGQHVVWHCEKRGWP